MSRVLLAGTGGLEQLSCSLPLFTQTLSLKIAGYVLFLAQH